MNTAKTETTVRIARRYTAGIALLSNPAYTFRQFEIGLPIFHVHNGAGAVYVTDLKWACCSCPDFQKNNEPCKHMYAAEEILREEAQVEQLDLLAEMYANAEDAEWGCCPL